MLRLPAVKARTGLCRTGIYNRVREGGFPRPVNLGGRAVGWRESDVEDWLASRPVMQRPGRAAGGQG
ncbi:MAG: AlpA family transcriptional regulator [Magnetococcales bacterium]|nr:AlpA family transcriptional regulator [Magnetococcales bacterium]